MFLNRNKSDEDISLITCKNGHIYGDNLQVIAGRMFNLVAGNFVGDTISLIHQQKLHKRHPSVRTSDW